MPRTLRIVLASSLLACTAAPAEPDATTSSSGGDDVTTTAPTTGEAPPTVAELASCDEVDLEPVFFMGPAFDPETGALIAPLPQPHLVATTVGWHTPEQLEPLSEHTTPVIMDVFAHDGLLGAAFAMSEACGSARTLTLWRDEAARMKFVFGTVHASAIKNGLPHTIGWETTHWTPTADEPLPGWELARQHLDERRQ